MHLYPSSSFRECSFQGLEFPCGVSSLSVFLLFDISALTFGSILAQFFCAAFFVAITYADWRDEHAPALILRLEAIFLGSCLGLVTSRSVLSPLLRAASAHSTPALQQLAQITPRKCLEAIIFLALLALCLAQSSGLLGDPDIGDLMEDSRISEEAVRTLSIRYPHLIYPLGAFSSVALAFALIFAFVFYLAAVHINATTSVMATKTARIRDGIASQKAKPGSKMDTPAPILAAFIALRRTSLFVAGDVLAFFLLCLLSSAGTEPNLALLLLFALCCILRPLLFATLLLISKIWPTPSL